MTPSEERKFAASIAAMLASQAAHGISTVALQGLGEISLRDPTIVAAASIGARLKQAWLLLREEQPVSWSGGTVDVVVARMLPTQIRWVAGIELKWWRRADPGNAGNRRRDLVKDFIRAASLYPDLEGPAFVALLSTQASWRRTTGTNGNDTLPMTLVRRSGRQDWILPNLANCPAVRGSLRALNGSVPVPNRFRSELISSVKISTNGTEEATARVWRLWKQQNTRFLSEQEIEALASR